MLQLMFLVVSRSFWLVIVTWIQLMHAIVNWHKNMCWRLILWTVNFFTFPIRAVSALQREKMVKRFLLEMLCELENLAWDNKKLQAKLQMAIKEHHFLESMLSELEEDHDKAILKVEILEREMQHLREENLRLREVRSKGQWDSTDKSDSGDEPITDISWQTSKIVGQPGDPSQDKDSWPNDKKPSNVVNPTGLFDSLTPLIFTSNVDTEAALNQRREVALYQSFFSSMLSLLVGFIIRAADDPCFPLVMALFAVVGLSLRSVFQFFSTIKNRPASDAVALLSFNWFILGTLAYPTFPQVVRLLCPVFENILDRTLA